MGQAGRESRWGIHHVTATWDQGGNRSGNKRGLERTCWDLRRFWSSRDRFIDAGWPSCQKGENRDTSRSQQTRNAVGVGAFDNRGGRSVADVRPQRQLDQQSRSWAARCPHRVLSGARRANVHTEGNPPFPKFPKSTRTTLRSLSSGCGRRQSTTRSRCSARRRVACTALAVLTPPCGPCFCAIYI